MPHFSRSALETDADGLARLHEILHGRNAGRSVKTREGRTADTLRHTSSRSTLRKTSPALPTIEERFGRTAGQGSMRPRGGRAVADGVSR